MTVCLRIAQLVLLGLVVATPWYFGGVSMTAVCAVGIAAVVLGGLVFTVGASEISMPPVSYVLLAAVGLGLFQLISLPEGALTSFAPRTARWYDTLLGDLATASAAESTSPEDTVGKSTISVAPVATRRATALLAITALVFISASCVLQDPRYQRLLLLGLTVNGAALAAFGIVQMLTWNGKLYWVFPSPVHNSFGPFVNRNNAAGFLGICLAAAAGLVSCELGSVLTSQRSRMRSRGPAAPRWMAAAEFLDRPMAVVGLVGFVIIAAGILCSLSRGGLIACVIGMLVWLFAERRRFPSPAHLATAVGATIALTVCVAWWSGQYEKVSDRLATLRSTETVSQESRLGLWQEVSRAIPDFAVLGSGLGTFQYVYSPYLSRPDDRQAVFAENQYLQSLIEGGVFGLGLLLAAIALLAHVFWRSLSAATGPRRGMILAAAVALAIQAIHGATDFGLYHAAQAVALACLLGGGLAASLNRDTWVPRFDWSGNWVSIPTLAFLWLVIINAGSLNNLLRARDVEVCLHEIEIADYEIAALEAEEISQRMSRLRDVLSKCWDHPEGHLRMAELALWRFEPLMQELGDAQVDFAAENSLIPGAMAMYRSVQRLRQNEQEDSVRLLAESPAVSQPIALARDHLTRALIACPFLPKAHLQLGFIRWHWALDGENSAFDRARRLAPRNSSVRFYLGVGELFAGEQEATLSDWHASLSVSDYHRAAILNLAELYMPAEVVAAEFMPDSAGQLLTLLQSRYGDSGRVDLKAAAIQRLETLVEAESLEPAERDFFQGSIASERGEMELAIEHFRKASSARPENLAWRYELAFLLAGQQEWEEAEELVRTCVEIEPSNRSYASLMRNIARRNVPPRIRR